MLEFTLILFATAILLGNIIYFALSILNLIKFKTNNNAKLHNVASKRLLFFGILSLVVG